jgi:phosphoesterase RecJ-like protein
MKSANVGLAPRRDRHEDVLPKVAEALRNAKRVLCVMHAHPDGDACGSTLGLALALRELGKDVTLFCHTEVPYNFRFLAGLEHLVREVPPAVIFDATTVCDVGASSRIGPGLPERARLGTFLNIDHHLTSDDFGDLNYVDAEAASVGVLIARILRAMGHPLSKDVAMALYVSVMTDTGSFRYSSTNPEAMRVAADLIEAGANPWDVSSAIYEQQPVARLQLLREVLGTLKVSADGMFACITVPYAVRMAAAGNEDLTDGFINFARGIRGVEVAAQFTEPAPGSADPWSLSFRSRGRVNVARVAQAFGGGGHHNAAGAQLHGTFDTVHGAVTAAVREECQRSVAVS